MLLFDNQFCNLLHFSFPIKLPDNCDFNVIIPDTNNASTKDFNWMMMMAEVLKPFYHFSKLFQDNHEISLFSQ